MSQWGYRELAMASTGAREVSVFVREQLVSLVQFLMS